MRLVPQAWIDRAMRIEAAADVLYSHARSAIDRADEGTGRLYAANRTQVESAMEEVARAINTPEPTIPLAASPKPTTVEASGMVERECAALLAAYIRKEIGILMHQAEHWAANGKPLAVHHRLMKADSYFQILVLMERGPGKGWKLPFDEIRASLARPEINPPGAYPPSKDLYRFRDPAFVVASLSASSPSSEQVERP
jgi:hypothetical protein